jgi:2-keto-4-pentenoate hydratase/2-oxohepta-3-ene-1,7-dioic acid hydratase in catechol pathway
VKWVRFEYESAVSYGLLNGDSVEPVGGDPFSGYRKGSEPVSLKAVRLLAPCVPSKIVAVGVNYRAHAAEFSHDLPKEPILFLKPPSAVLDPGEAIRLPAASRRVDFEAELAVVVGVKTRSIAPEKAPGAILGYTCFNDVTARDLQKRDGQWARAKSFDTFAPFGPWIETDADPGSLKIESYLNGERRQSASTEDLIFKVPELVSFISGVMTLFPGDVIATGTPAGVGPMQPGDVIEIAIEGIGRLRNPVNK